MSFLLNGDNSTIWYEGLNNEWGRLSQGNDHGIRGTNTTIYIKPQYVPKDRVLNYGSFLCEYTPLKDEKWRVRLVVGKDTLPYELNIGSSAASILETTILAIA